ncbi:uncharacterized protein OGAPODRAFT_76840 [Ogataea polymorpha]|uniref:uncharacterized protein n=1 Tax=Ogataea polymorpha TaxID=460523 RepID=UPI0007F4D747|nr:uncharacterized protein OGAPODRAFT_76840 [Ogataea polymorpha]OBA15978.1 hypothetical protein OGAPODRAFT_76840 [Ogataea polymorpha]
MSLSSSVDELSKRERAPRRQDRTAVNLLLLLTSVLISFALKSHLRVSLSSPFSVNLLVLCAIGSLAYLYYSSLPLDPQRFGQKIGLVFARIGRVLGAAKLSIVHIIMLILVLSALVCNETRFLYFLLPFAVVWAVNVDPSEMGRQEASSAMELRLEDMEAEINNLKLGLMRRQHNRALQDRSLEFSVGRLQQELGLKLRASNEQIQRLQLQISELQNAHSTNGWLRASTKTLLKIVLTKNQIRSLRYLRQQIIANQHSPRRRNN